MRPTFTRNENLEIPPFDDDEVLVRVRAASAKPWRWDPPAIVTLIARMTARFRKPKTIVPGLDFAGEVEAVGKRVTRLQPGAEVFGWAKVALAEYVAVNEDSLTLKPSTVSVAEAANLAVSGPRHCEPCASWIGPIGRIITALITGPFVSQTYRPFYATPEIDNLLTLTELIEDDKITPIIDRTYPLSDAAAAVRSAQHDHVRGKIVLTE